MDWDGAELKTERNVPQGASATAPAEPVRQGYTFTGWDKDFSNITSDITVTAEYIVVDTRTFSVYWNANGGALANPSETGRYNLSRTDANLIPDANPTREGYRFEGWALTGAVRNSPYSLEPLWPVVIVSRNDTFGELADYFRTDIDTLILVAQWTRINEHGQAP